MEWKGLGVGVGGAAEFLSRCVEFIKNLLEPVQQRHFRETARGAAQFGSCQQEGKNQQV